METRTNRNKIFNQSDMGLILFTAFSALLDFCSIYDYVFDPLNILVFLLKFALHFIKQLMRVLQTNALETDKKLFADQFHIQI